MSFEAALAELEGIVQKLERGQLDLESSIQAYERGTALRQHCAEKLRQVQLRVEKLTLDREGNAEAGAVRGVVTRPRCATPMAAVADAIEAELDRLLPAATGPQARLHEAMRYAVLGGGKRLRPLLVAASAELFGVAPAAATRVGAAVELVHAYSLIHDDLPAMDDAALRRGRPSCHRAFDEATAILAGDALQPLAFEVLARADYGVDAGAALRAGAGPGAGGRGAGMCGGQMIDLQAERQALTLDEITLLQGLKTGALIAFACDAGAILGRAGDAERAALAGYAHDLGLAFQIKDDLLDRLGRQCRHRQGCAGATRLSARPPSSASWARHGARAKLAELQARRRPPALTSSVPRSKVLRQAARLRDRPPIISLRAGEFQNDDARRRSSTRSTRRRTCAASTGPHCAQLADELRQETIDAVSVTGGHLGAGLGVVELTVALHYVFDTPHDRLIWDVGHQAYPHKILTGRRERIRTLRQPGGLSGFTRRAESDYDPFGAAHSSTSISAGLGMATAAKLEGVEPQRRRGDRRRGDERRHGLRGDEQCRRACARG